MCVAKPGRILETIPKQAIDANMGGPNQPIGQQPKPLVDDREYDEQQGCHKRVDQVIEGCPKPYARKIAQHRKIWYQDQHDKYDAAGSCFSASKQACAKYNAALSAEKQTRTRKHALPITQYTVLQRARNSRRTSAIFQQTSVRAFRCNRQNIVDPLPLSEYRVLD